MFRKLHRQMTFFCALITGIILIVLTLACLFFSENAMRQSHTQAFSNNLNSVISYMESQTVISGQWLAKTENDQNFMIGLYDAGVPFHHNSLRGDEQREYLLGLAASVSADSYGLNIFEPAGNQILSQHQRFTIRDSEGREYYAATAVFPKDYGYLSAVMVSSFAGLDRQISVQRLQLVLLDLVGIAVLTLFSYFFTARMLRPLEESRNKQVQFVAAASHELRTPLAVILSSLSALKKAKGHDRERFEENMEAESLRMSRLVDDMLTLASTDNQSWSVNPAMQDMDTLALELYERFLPLYRKQGIHLLLCLPEEPLPRHSCDKARVQQALSILLDNALSYTPEGGNVSLGVQTQNSKIQFSVADSGPGVPNDQKALIFERFYRGDSARGGKEHFGLGLCIAQEIALLHKGKLWVEDGSAGGAVFHLLV